MQNQDPLAGAQALQAVLVVDGDEGARRELSLELKQRGVSPTAVATVEPALVELERRRFDAVLCTAEALRAPLLAALDDAVALVVLGGDEGSLPPRAYAALARPVRAEELARLLRNLDERLRLVRENQTLRRALAERAVGVAAGAGAIVGTSEKMQELLRTVRKIGEHKTTVLITGESGTGKELIARALHASSPRKDGPFVAVNCGAIPEALLESELFGHKKGSFTDAVRDKRGLFSEADGGTLFLDEIGELPLGPQVKLLRVLADSQVRPVGGTEDEQVDVRVIAATMRDLAADVAQGRFREDLFYRLNVIQLHLPPLRERREDLPALIEHFLARTNQKLGTHVRAVTPEAMRMLSTYSWPGNIRELENTIERSVVLCEGDALTAEGLPERLHQRRDPVGEALQTGELSIKKTVRVIEEALIRKALQQTRGNRTNAAKKLEISHRALLYKMKEYQVNEPPAGGSRAVSAEKSQKVDDEG